MASTSRRKKKRLESSTKYMAIGIVVGGALLVLAVVLPLVIYFSANSRETDEPEKLEVKQPGLPEMIARTDALEATKMPKGQWKWNLLLAKRPSFPNNQSNGANMVLAVQNALPKTSQYYKDLSAARPTQTPNVRLTPDEVNKLKSSVSQMNNVINYLHKMPPSGAFPLQLERTVDDPETQKKKIVKINPYDVDFSHVDLVAKAIWILEANAILSLEQGDLNGADQSLKAILSMCRYLRHEYNKRSQLARLGGLIVASDVVERIMAQTPQLSFDLLTEYQSLFQQELTYNEFVETMRAERGMFDYLCDHSRDGKMSWKVRPPSSGGGGGPGTDDMGMGDPGDPMMDDCGGQEPGQPPDPGVPGGEDGGSVPEIPTGIPYVLGGIKLEGMIPDKLPKNDNSGGNSQNDVSEPSEGPGMGMGGDSSGSEDLDLTQAWYLGYINEMVYLSREPTEKLLAGIDAWKKKEAPKAPGKAQSSVPDCKELAKLYLRKLAKIRATVMGIAAERYRLNRGQWPANPGVMLQQINPNDEMSPRFLNRVYEDPYNGRAMFYRVDPQKGIVFYSVGEDLNDNQVMFGIELNTWAKNSDVGFRVWNPANRYTR